MVVGSNVARRIIIFGATGFTGRQVAERLAVQGAAPVLAPVFTQAPDAEQHREHRGQQDQHRVDPAEVHS